MPDETSGVRNVYFGVVSDGGVQWQPLQDAVSFEIESTDDTPFYEHYILDDTEPKLITLTFPWWFDQYSFACEIFGFDCKSRKQRRTIRQLRRNGKSHKGKR